MKRGVVLVALAGCVGHGDEGSEWLPAETVEGELALSAGPAPTLRSAPGCKLRVATFNVHYAGDPDNIAAHIKASAYVGTADVIMIQETRAYTAEEATRTQRIADALAMTWAHAPAKTVTDPQAGTHGNAIISKWPLENVAVRRLPDAQHYRIRFLANAGLYWQKRSLHAISYFGGDLVSVENT